MIGAGSWLSILGQKHPEWDGASEKTKRRIRNKAWAYGYQVDDRGYVSRKPTS